MLTGHGPQTQWVPVGVPYVPNGMIAPGMMAPGMVFGPAYGYASPGPISTMTTADGLRGAYAFGGMPTAVQGADEAAALAERLNELQLGARGRGPVHGPGGFARGGLAGPSGMPGPGLQSQFYYTPGPPMQMQPQQQQQPQQQSQQSQQQQHMGRGRQGRGGRGGMPQQHSGRGPGQQAQKKKRPQKGLEENIRRTVYISYVDCSLTEENLAAFFSDCGRILDCRICGDPNSAMRFAFIEFMDVECAAKALEKTGSVLGNSPLRVLPSKTAIMPVNQELMPRSADEVERCSRTVYAANIDKKVDKNDVKAFFESLCGKVSRIRLLGDYAHSTRIAFVEFHHAEGALAALNCSGALLGSLPIRVSPSKTPVRVDGSNKDSDGMSSSAQSVQSMPASRPSGAGSFVAGTAPSQQVPVPGAAASSESAELGAHEAEEEEDLVQEQAQPPAQQQEREGLEEQPPAQQE